MRTLRIYDLNDRGVLAFDVHELLRALAPRSLAASWAIKTPDFGCFEATGSGGALLEHLAEMSARITGNELLAIAADTVQVIWGDFVATLADDPHGEWLTIRAVDSSFFEVETSDELVLAKIKSGFHDVRCVQDAA